MMPPSNEEVSVKAIKLDAHRTPVLDDVADPGLAPAGHVLLRVEAAALNPADVKVIAGGFDGRLLHATGDPLLLGFDFSGVVEAVGAGVTTLRVGDAAFGHLPYSGKNAQGSLSDFLLVPAESVAIKPDAVEHAAAAASATTGSTALQGLRDKGRLQPGGRVLINGASGGVGAHAVQIARLLGAEAVVGTCSAAKMDFVSGLGATAVDYRQTPLTAIEGGPFDVILDAAATASYRACRSLLTPRGAYVTTLPGAGLLLDMLWAAFSERRAGFVVVRSRQADLAQLGAWMAAGELEATLDTTVPRTEIERGLARLQSGAVQGKVAITLR